MQLSKTLKSLAKLVISFFKLPMLVLFFLSRFAKRNNDLWVFSAWHGKQYRGSSRYFFEYISKNKNKNIVWLTKSLSLNASLKKRNIKSYYLYSFQGLNAMLRAKYFFVSHGVNDLFPSLVNGAEIVSLGHVISPIKKNSVADSIRKLPLFKRFLINITDPYTVMNLVSYEVVASKNTIGSTMYLNDVSKILPLGLPKIDYQLSVSKTLTDNKSKSILQKIIPEKLFKEKIIVFMPTWRNNQHFSIFDEGFDVNRLNNILEKTNSILLINLHPFDQSSKFKIIFENPRVFITLLDGEDSLKVLCLAELFITDYSSLFSDFLLTERPIIFANFAHYDYLRERELNFPYDELPGEKATNWLELESKIFSILFLNEDKYSKERKKFISHIFDGNNDGLSCERIFNFFNN